MKSSVLSKLIIPKLHNDKNVSKEVPKTNQSGRSKRKSRNLKPNKKLKPFFHLENNQDELLASLSDKTAYEVLVSAISIRPTSVSMHSEKKEQDIAANEKLGKKIAHSSANQDEQEQQDNGSAQQETNGTASCKEDAAMDNETDGTQSDNEEEEEASPVENGNGNVEDPASATNSWLRHVNRVLSEEEVARLRAASRVFRDIGDVTYQGVWPGVSFKSRDLASLAHAPDRLARYAVKERLRARWLEVALKADDGSSTPASLDGDFVHAQQRTFFTMLDSYADVMCSVRPYPQCPSLHPDFFQDAYLLHALNHVMKTADVVKKNNARMEGASAAAPEDVPRDMGFTRPKVLILLPQRNFAFRAVTRLVSLAVRETRADSVINKARFVEQFANMDEEASDEEDGTGQRKVPKPAEHRALFGGNLDDHFLVGVKITRGAVRLFGDIFQSDIVVASPLAVATSIAEERAARAAAGGTGLGTGCDWLSSIEVLIADRCDVLGMQNWTHMETVVENLNKLPREQHGTDIMRVREWYLAGLARHYRQTVFLSSFSPPDALALYSRTAASHAGAIRMDPVPAGVLQEVVQQVQQLFERFNAPDLVSISDARFAAFQDLVYSRIRDTAGSGILVFVPSYFDFVRVRNFLKAEEASFVSVSEYSSSADVTRQRSRFYHAQRRIMLYTERAHFYNRYSIRGIKDIVFYGVPDHAHFYSEIANLLEGATAATSMHARITTLFCRFDALALARVVGVNRSKKMLKGESSTFMFC